MLNKKTAILSFVFSLAVIGVSAYMFVTVLNNKLPKTETKSTTKTPIQQTAETEYYQPNDNVGAVTFTEDQLTELARKIFFADDYFKDFKIELESEKIIMSGKISNKQNLIKAFPKLKKYDAVLGAVVGKTLSFDGSIQNNNGRAALKVDTVSVAGLEVDPGIVSPFIENGDFAKLFDTEYDNIEITHGSVIFKNGVPEILEY